MTYSISIAEVLLSNLLAAPKKVSKSLHKSVLPRLRESPSQVDPPAIKKMTGDRALWRYRIGDYRLIYSVDESIKDVTLLVLKNRKTVYGRPLDENSSSGEKVRVSDTTGASSYRSKSDKEDGANQDTEENDDVLDSIEPAGQRDSILPSRLTKQILKALHIPAQFHDVFANVRTEGQLLGLSNRVPPEMIERVMNWLWPPSIDQAVERPTRVIVSDSQIEAIVNKDISIESLMLRLDDSQKPFVAQFESGLPTGPWMAKGGPGSGKSTIMLHCIRGLLQQGRNSLDLDGNNVRILFTTYTKALVAAAQQLISAFNVSDSRFELEASNVDKLVARDLPPVWGKFKPRGSSTGEIIDIAVDAIFACQERNKQFGFQTGDIDFLLEEIEWLILGDKLSAKEEYLAVSRAGRGRRLGANQRLHVWEFHEEFRQGLRNARTCLWTHRLAAAEEAAVPRYDYVFIDEAQDLKPVAIRFLVKLAKDPRNVFLTADANQTIYGVNMAWAKVSEALNFRGRSRILRRNYRTTSEVWQAIRPIASQISDIDDETLEVETPFHGPMPALGYIRSIADEARLVSSWLHSALLNERLSLGCAAILCPTNSHCESLQRSLPSEFRARVFSGSEMDISYDGVKIITMHSAKGLQFPVVVVTGLKDGLMPRAAASDADQLELSERQRRLFFVACSRAARRLLVCADKEAPSPFLAELDKSQWEAYDN